jgi:hypothetical protein
MRQQVLKQGTITSAWLRMWGLNVKGANPPFGDVIPENLEYLRPFAMGPAYVDEQGLMESKGLWNPSVHTKEDYKILSTT